MTKKSYKNAAQVAPTSAGVEESGQKIAEAAEVTSENSEAPSAVTGEASATVNDQAHDAAQTVDAAEEIGNNNIPQGEICFVDVAELELNPLSEALYGADVPEALKVSIEEEGIASPIIVSRSSGRVLSGNTRLKIAKEVGVETVPVVYIEGELTEEEETNFVLTYNVERDKTHEMKVHEYKEHLRIEKGLAGRRRARKPAGAGKVPQGERGKARDIAAAKVGFSASALESGVKVLSTMEDLKAKGNLEAAEELRKKLNADGFTTALNTAIGKGWYRKNGAVAQGEDGAEVQANAKAKEPVGGGGVEKAEAGKVDKSGKKAAVDAGKQADAKPDPEDDVDALEAAQSHIEALEAFLREEATMALSDAAKADLGRAIGRLNATAMEAGIYAIVE